MRSSWRNTDPTAKLLAETDALPAEEVSLATAQIDANCVVFGASTLPARCFLKSVTQRPEQPPGRPGMANANRLSQTPWSEANPFSVRMVVEGPGRRLRIKQFLYDWAPPAASIAPLAGRDARPYRSGDYVCWVGTDYKGRVGACIQKRRTQIEISVEMGLFSDSEIVAIFNGLLPADEEVAAEIDKTPFHHLSYWFRYRMKSTKVPHGLWKYRAAHSYEEARSGRIEELSKAARLPARLPRHDLYAFDSAALSVVGQARAPHLEYIFRSKGNGSDHLWFLVTGKSSNCALPARPEPEDYPAEFREHVRMRGRDVRCAALDSRYGGWEAMWEEGDALIAVWASSSLGLDYAKFKALIETLD